MERRPRKKEGGAVRVIVYGPETTENWARLAARAAKFHAEYVVEYIEGLHCPTDQKLRLIEAIAKTVPEGTEKERKAHT